MILYYVKGFTIDHVIAGTSLSRVLSPNTQACFRL